MLNILLIEDSEDDQVLFSRAAEKCGLPVRVTGLRSGREAIDYLEARGTYSDRGAHPIPDLIMLDLEMPGMDGLAFLGWRYTSLWAKTVPTVVFSGLEGPELAARAADAGAAGFVRKPQDLSDWPAAIVEACRLGGLRVTTHEAA
jgi:two-component system response regulator